MIAPNAQVHLLQPYTVRHRTIHRPEPRLVTPDDAQRAEAIRLSALEADARATTQINVTLLWRELARGTSTVVDSFFSDERCHLVLASKTGADAAPLEGRRLEIAEAVLGAQPQKNIAADLGLAASTIALNARLALESIGVECRPSRAHPLLMLAARSSQETTLIQASCATFVAADERELRVVSVPRPDRRLARVLPPAELIVIRWLIEGLSYREIAERRGTSTRTIANQITAVFRRLRVSGRNELVHRLFFEEDPTGAPAPVKAETLAPLQAEKPKTMLEFHAQRRSA